MDKNPSVEVDVEYYRRDIDSALGDLIAEDSGGPTGLVGEAVAHSLLAPGKRIRPLLTLLATAHFGGRTEDAMVPGCAIELIHTASLIFDDLPCMDDSSIRRGRGAAHAQFGEDIAILAGLYCVNRAFEITASASGISPEQRLDLLAIICRAVGPSGLISGQEKDLHCAGRRVDWAAVRSVHYEKTGSLFVAAAEIGAKIAGGAAADVAAAREYATYLGIAFQSIDDLIDSCGSAVEFGKDVGQDTGRSNVVSIVGRNRALRETRNLIGRAVAAVSSDTGRKTPLGEFACMFLTHGIMGGDVTSAAVAEHGN